MEYLHLLLWIFYTTIVFCLLYLIGTWNNKYFVKYGIKYEKPVPFFGCLTPLVFRSKPFANIFSDLYNKYPESNLVGVFDLLKPVIMVRDPEIIRQITVKDFDYFVDHRSNIDEDVDPLFGRGLVSMNGNKWRDMRSTLSPAFTGSKMRTMFGLVVDCAEQVILFLKKNPEGATLEFKDLLSRFSNDVIATTAFGVKVDSLQQRDNEFFLNGKQVTNLSGFQALKFFGFSALPSLMKLFRIKFWGEKVSNFFRKLVHDTIKTRDKEGTYRPDMIQLLMQARKGTLSHESLVDKEDAGFATVQEFHVHKEHGYKREWTDDDMTAQAMIFFLAGFEAISTAMCFIFYELAVNSAVQERLTAEIDDFVQQGNKMNYENIQKLKYLDMVVSESLRKWSPGILMDRKCVKPYILKDPKNNISIPLKPGDGIWIPNFAIQNDPKYFPDPEKFDPERFNDQNKDTIKPFTYIPFGTGPRNCIGSRFALMEAKAMIFHILADFSLEPCSKTQIPIKLVNGTINLQSKNGFWLRLNPRSL